MSEDSRLDLNQLVRKGTVELGSEEHPDERAARLRREERRERIEQRKGVALFSVALAGVVVVSVVCGHVAFFAAAVDEPKRQLAHNLLVAVVAGYIAFLSGRSLPKG